jgi:PleD family two-component response regulator
VGPSQLAADDLDERTSVRRAEQLDREKRLTHRILIVDDDLHIREVIRIALEEAGMAVSEARDGKR